MTPTATFTVLTFAVFRVVRLITADAILTRPRAWFFDRWPSTFERSGVRSVWNPVRREIAYQPRGARDHAASGLVPKVGDKVVVNGDKERRTVVAVDGATVTTVDWPRVSSVGRLVECAWCLGFWLSGVAVAAADHLVSVPMPFAMWLAISAGVGILSKWGA